jgi:uncharacterized membrane protein YhaH (DUF805 family)
MSFGQAIAACFTRYADFNGRATRPEFWWFLLFTLLAAMALAVVNRPLSLVFQIGVLLPSLAVGARRLHDTDRSGWLQLLYLVPVAGWIVVLILMAQAPREPNRFGANAAG